MSEHHDLRKITEGYSIPAIEVYWEGKEYIITPDDTSLHEYDKTYLENYDHIRHQKDESTTVFIFASMAPGYWSSLTHLLKENRYPYEFRTTLDPEASDEIARRIAQSWPESPTAELEKY